MNRLEAVVICVDYADYLAETLPFLLPHVDDVVVVTSPDDGRTHRICKQYGVRFLPTRCFYREGEPFNKARGINYGLANLKLDGWVLHVDADTVLPSRTRYLLGNVDLDPRKLYGCDRVHCLGRAAWDDLKADPEVQYEWNCLVKPPRRWRWRPDRPHGVRRILPDRVLPVVESVGLGRVAISPRGPGDGRALRRAPCHPVGSSGPLPHPRIDLHPPGDEGQGRLPPYGAELVRPHDSGVHPG